MLEKEFEDISRQMEEKSIAIAVATNKHLFIHFSDGTQISIESYNFNEKEDNDSSQLSYSFDKGEKNE